jgi:hypothetical protein
MSAGNQVLPTTNIPNNLATPPTTPSIGATVNMGATQGATTRQFSLVGSTEDVVDINDSQDGVNWTQVVRLAGGDRQVVTEIGTFLRTIRQYGTKPVSCQVGDLVPTGATGASGPTGATGATGPTGATGTGGSDAAWFGDGSDGPLVYDGTSTVLGVAPVDDVYTLTRTPVATTLQVNSGVTINANGSPIFAMVSITNAGHINCDGGAGGNASASTGGSAGEGGNDADNGPLGSGSNGAAGNSGAAGGGAAGAANQYGFPGATNAGNGGQGGQAVLDADTYLGGVAGVVTQAVPVMGTPRHVAGAITGSTLGSAGGVSICGGAGGGSGASAGSTSAGGGGAGGGGVLLCAAPLIINSGTISVNGGNGGAAFAPASFCAGGGAGGGGGYGVFICTTLTNTGTISANGGSGGAGAGTGGAAGAEGIAGTILQLTA